MKFRSLPLSMSTALLLLIPSCQNHTATDAKQKDAAGGGAHPTSTTTASAGVVTLPSGLRYKVIVAGPAGGKSPTINDSVTVHYKGTLTNGTQFDSSYDRGTPTTFGVGQVIPGWTEALQLMKPGDQWAIFIPAHLGYGSQPMGNIPANSDLVFQVNLLHVNGAQ